MKPSFLLAAILLGSCMPKPVLKPHEEIAGRAAWTAWQRKALPTPTEGRCHAERFYVETPSIDEFPTFCPTSVWHKTAGCLSWRSTNHFFAWKDYPVVVVSPKHYSEPTIIVHELMHAYVHCSRIRESNAWDPGDRQHADPRVWSAAGGADAAQSIADDLAAKGMDGGTR